MRKERDEQAIIAAYLSGKSLEDLGNEFNVSSFWVFRCLKRHNIPRRKVGLPCPVSNERMFELRRAGLSFSEIGFVVGMTKSGVHRRLQSAGIGM